MSRLQTPYICNAAHGYDRVFLFCFINSPTFQQSFEAVIIVAEQTLITNVKYHPLGSLGWLAHQHHNVEGELRVKKKLFAFFSLKHGSVNS